MTSLVPLGCSRPLSMTCSCILLVVVSVSIFTDVTVAQTWSSPNITQLGASMLSENKKLWDYQIGGYLVQLLPVTTSGTLFAFSAMFRNLNPVDIIVWRPVGDAPTDTSGPRPYSLLWKLTVSGSSLLNEEFIYVEAKLAGTCAQVRPGDWIGVFSTHNPFPIAFIFDLEAGAKLRSRTWSEPNSPNVKQEIQFAVRSTNSSEPQWPLNVLFAAYVLPADDTSEPTVQCPRGLIVSSSLRDPTTTAAPRPVVGATGQNGPMGYTGMMGPPGLTGERGPTGEPGSPGSKEGASGGTGDQGQAGPQGDVKGATGQRGINGSQGDVGFPGLTGASGPTGATGVQGPIGENQTFYAWSNGSYLTAPERASPNPFWVTSIAVTAMYIWLAIGSGVSLATFVLLIVTCTIYRDLTRPKLGR